MEYLRYKGKGEHSVNELEKIIEQREEELHLIKIGDVVKNNDSLDSVMRGTLEQKEATYKMSCEWFETEYDSNSDGDKVAEQEKVCYGLNEQIKLLRLQLSEYCA